MPNARLCSVPQKETNAFSSGVATVSGTDSEVVLNRPGYFHVQLTYSVA